MEAVIEAERSRKAGISSRAIAVAAIRYYLLKYHLQTEVVFDLQKATEVAGNTGVYLLYSYARAHKVLERAAKEGRGNGAFPDPGLFPAELNEQEHGLIRRLAYWPEAFDAALTGLAPNLICNYAFELASLFNHFYSTCPILKGP
ncbi:hypothetical protein LJK88_18045 [Paenibacillus sp. P26]|nr:hypothetical protein LJK88_18045 [Paenibacillus sp. P26]